MTFRLDDRSKFGFSSLRFSSQLPSVDAPPSGFIELHGDGEEILFTTEKGKRYFLFSGIKEGSPSSSSSFGKKGQIRYDSNYIYICVDDNTWKRVALTSF